jgi:hypothetical protein
MGSLLEMCVHMYPNLLSHDRDFSRVSSERPVRYWDSKLYQTTLMSFPIHESEEVSVAVSLDLHS